MEFRLLGPLEVVDGGRPLALGGPKQRSLLAILLLHIGQVVSTERLIDELWGESPPATVAKSIQAYVSRLRKQIGEHRLLTRSPGYILLLDPPELDLARFEQLVAGARGADPERAARQLREALGLWRGPPLADLAYQPFAQAQIARLEELRLTALEERIDADLRTGRHAELGGELEVLVAAHPLRERLRGQLMLGLYRSGRQAEALEVHRAARRVLVEELGIEPSRDLQELQRAILAQDVALDLAAQPPRPAPGPRIVPPPTHGSPLVGREAELGALEAALGGALAGHGSLVLVAGEAGIGKSRLLEAFRASALSAGARVLSGRCWEAGGAPAYWPWVHALRSLVADCDATVLRADPGASAVLSTIVPEVRDRCPDLPEPPALEGDAARFWLFDAIARLLKRAAAARPLAVTLDDLHVADVPSMLLLRFVSGELKETPIVLVGAYRDAEMSRNQDLAPALAAVWHDPDTVQVQLTGLAADEVSRLVESLTGVKPAQRTAAALYEETEGNPLFVTEVTRLLTATGATLEDHQAVLIRSAVPTSVREVIRRRLREMPESSASLLTIAAILGREFDLDVLTAVARLPSDQALDRLHPAMAAGVLGQVPGDQRRLRFSHALVRDALDEELSPGDRMRLHRKIGETLETVYRDRLDPHLSQLAHHFANAQRFDDDDRAIRYARRAGDRAAGMLAFEEAARLYSTALRAETRRPVDAALRADLLLALGDAWARAGEADDSKHAFLEAAAVGRAASRADVVAHAALGFGGRFLWPRAASDRRLVPILEDAVEALGEDDSRLRVQVLARLATAVRGEEPERRERVIAEAVASARRIGDPSLVAYALDARCGARWSADTIEEIRADADEVIALAKATADLEREFAGREHAMEAAWALGEMRLTRSHINAMGLLADALGQPAQQWLITEARGQLAMYEGRLDDAAALVERAREIGSHTMPWNATATHRLQTFLLAGLQGRLADFEPTARRSAMEYPDYPIFACVLADLTARLGRHEEARAAVEALAADDFDAVGHDEMRLGSMMLIAEVAAGIGHAEHAASIYREFAPHSALVVTVPPELHLDCVSRVLGRLAGTLERWEDAEHHFAAAHAQNVRIGARPWIPIAAHEHAAVLNARGRPQDRRRARELLARSITGYRELGMEARAREAAALHDELS